MTKEEIIEMGHKAKLPYDYVTGELMWLDSLEQFAKWVAEKERDNFLSALRGFHDSISLASNSNRTGDNDAT
jgi:hypothetical protein